MNNINKLIEIEKEVNNILTYEDKSIHNCVSIFDLITVIKNLSATIKNLKTVFNNRINEIIYPNFLKIKNFDYEKLELNNTLFLQENGDYKAIDFIIAKKNNKINSELIIIKNNLNVVYKYFELLYPLLLEYFYKMNHFKPFMTFKDHDIKSINTSFFINVNRDIINIYNLFNNECLMKIYMDLFNYLDYEYNSNYESIKSLIKENEEKFLNNIFININDCPNFSQTDLHKIKRKQLEEQKKRKRFQDKSNHHQKALTKKYKAYKKY